MRNYWVLCGFVLSAVCGTAHAVDYAITKTPLVACVKGEKADVPPNPKMYMKKGVKVKCSANINISYIQGQSGVAVGANSAKGTSSYMGSSITGTVVPYKLCPSGCNSDDATTAAVASVPLGAL